MSGIVFENVSKYYGEITAVKGLSLSVQEGERLILLGPSGCGKTTTLRMVAGLEKITSGILKMGGHIMNMVEPGARNIAMVFQNYALYPHMTVWENITFGLSIRKVPNGEIKARAEKALEILNLSGYEQRKPHELSGGQKQRVALGRSLVKQAPYFLLDEPLSNLDAQLRLQARTELVKIHELYRPTLMYVTHDQIEAMSVGQRIAVMNQGILQQLDTPDIIYQYPANTFVASFIGAPPMNLLQGRLCDGNLRIAGCDIKPPAEWRNLLASHSELWVGIRPEHCRLSDNSLLRGRVEFTELLGSQRCVHVRLQGDELVLCVFPAEQSAIEGTAGISFSWDHVNGFDSHTGCNIGRPHVRSSI